jgi:hypothetical protein
MTEPVNTKQTNFLGEWERSAREAAKESIAAIEKLTDSVDAVRLFVAVVANLAIHPAEQYSDAVHGGTSKKIEILAYHLYPRFSLSSNRQINPWDIDLCLNALDKLFADRMIGSILARREAGSEEGLISAELRIEPEVVRGSAFPEQTADEIVSIQGRHESWFEQKVGIGPSRAQSLLQAISKNHEKRIIGALPTVRAHAATLAERYQNAKRKIPRLRSGDDHRFLRMFKKRSVAVGIWLCRETK